MGQKGFRFQVLGFKVSGISRVFFWGRERGGGDFLVRRREGEGRRGGLVWFVCFLWEGAFILERFFWGEAEGWREDRGVFLFFCFFWRGVVGGGEGGLGGGGEREVFFLGGKGRGEREGRRGRGERGSMLDEFQK